MNILFISFDADPPYMGGTSTVVNVLAKAFQTKGHFVALGYFDDSTHPSQFFTSKIKLTQDNQKAIELFFDQNKFDIIYNTQAMSTDFTFLKSFPLGDCKIISAYHNKPLLRFFPLESLMNLVYESKNPIYKLYTLAKIPLLPIWKHQSQKNERLKYRNMVDQSDKILLLSKKYDDCFLKIVPDMDRGKLIAIENPVVFESKFQFDELHNKKKKVIVVCSTNYQKRAYLMIGIWAELEKDSSLNDWSFDFVGGGEGFQRIKDLAVKMKLKRIQFLGVKNPEENYKESSLFMMTSRFEGWPMVLMEAMQMGAVPVVFNSFEAVNDIIDDGHNGYIVTNNDISAFVDKMKYLMKNDELRISMAKNAIASCDRFTIDKISEKYLTTFETLHLNKLN